MWLFIVLILPLIPLVYLIMLQNRKSKNNFAKLNYERQALPIQGQPGVWKCGYLTEHEGDFIEKFYPEVNTLWDLFQRGKSVSISGDCLGSRQKDGSYEYLSFEEVESRARALGAAFVKEYALTPGNLTNIGIYSKNCPAWAITMLASVQHSMPIVPLYDTLGPDAASYIVKQAEIKLVVVDTMVRARSLLESNNNQSLSLQHVVVIEEEDINEDDQNKAKEVGITLSTISSAIQTGKKLNVELHLPKPDDTYIICYTSGTTGNPKGVILTHRNVVANNSAWLKMIHTFMPEVEQPLPDETHISYLPLSHMIEQLTHWTMLGNGIRIGYFRGNIQSLSEDIQTIRPTIFPTVPRILNRLYDAVQAKLKRSGPIARFLFRLAYNRKAAMLKKGIISNTTIWDKIVFSKIQNQMGGRVRQMVTGSAPLSPQVLEFCRVALGCMIVEAYGQTETTSLVCVSWPKDGTAGHVGGPTPCCNVKLADVPDLNYYASNMQGEILVKGPGITSGYYKDPEKTAELFDEEGFLRTGDIGEILPSGKIRIIDRKKHIFKLAQGEYVAPEKIESIYTRASCVQQVFVDGNSLERWLIAVVVPEPEVLCSWANEHGYSGKNIEDIVEDPKAEEYVLNELQAIGKQHKLNSIEQVKKVILTAEPFSIENGLLTPTMKAKRPQLRGKFKSQMDSIYRINVEL